MDVGDPQLACEDVGAGSPVVWQPGSRHRAWTNLGRNVSASERHRNIVVDLPGCTHRHTELSQTASPRATWPRK